MIYLLLKPYIHEYHVANLFHYITFRMFLSLFFSLFLSIVFGGRIIKFLKKFQISGQPIRDCGPETHFSKSGTPTMGGVIIILPVILSTILFSDITNLYVLSVIFIILSYFLLGLYDDYMKINKNNHHGITAKQKLFYQIITAFISCLIIYSGTSEDIATILTFPFLKNFILDLGFVYLIFGVFVIVGASNAVNLTDGLDGLAIMPIVISFSSFLLISYIVGNLVYTEYLKIIYIPGVEEISIICSAIAGAGLGFLWYNAQPAEIFMGDTGSLSLGGALGAVSVTTKNEFILAIIGGIFVIETLSVILQVYYFKYNGGKRLLKMAPIHHHFEKIGWPESKVVIRFWIISVIFAIIGLSSFKLR